MRVWIGCLACYNGGNLVGRWYDASEAGSVTTSDLHGRDMTAWQRSHDGRGVIFRRIEFHEELWVMDVDEAPHEGLCREMSPSEAQAIADHIDDLEARYIDPEAYAAYCDNLGYSFTEADPSDFEESFSGEWNSREDFAYDLAESMGTVPEGHDWPASYIDWAAATRDLFMDYFDAPAPGGRVYVFRSF